MRHRLIQTSLPVLLLFVMVAAKPYAQESFSPDWALSQLRGGWEYRTYRDKWTLVFESDHKMLLDREPADYTLIPGAIRIQDENGSTDYPYTFEGKNLKVTLPDGSTRTYRKTDPGDAEQLVHGTLYSSVNYSSDRENLSFDGDHSFVFQNSSSGDNGQTPSVQDRHDSMVENHGVYRVEDEIVIVAFDDGTSGEAQIRYRDEDGSVAGIIFEDRLFEIGQPVVSAPPGQDPMASQPPAGIVTIYIPVQELPPAYQLPSPPPAGTGSTQKASEKTDAKPRDFGNTRGKPGDR